jgi:hypothetical protein
VAAQGGMNTLGAVLTGVVAVVIVSTKFTQGAWIVVVAVPLLVALFYAVNRHYKRVAEVLKLQNVEELQRLADDSPVDSRTTVVIFVAQVNSLTARALALARALSPNDVRAVTISNDPAATERLQVTWTSLGITVPLEVVDSPYREFVKTAVAYIRSLQPRSRAHGHGRSPRVGRGTLVGSNASQPGRASIEGLAAARALGRGHEHPSSRRRRWPESPAGSEGAARTRCPTGARG